MKKDFLREIPKDKKVDFLNKLQSGNFNLEKPYKPQPELNFKLQDNGLYKCKETGEKMSLDEIELLPGYRFSIELVSDPKQVQGTKPADGILLIPIAKDEYLDSLLKDPDK